MALGPFDWLDSELAQLEAQGLRRARKTVDPLPRGRCRVGEQEFWDFASNDYLGLSRDPRVIAAAEAAVRATGTGARASALVCGRTSWHARLEDRLAKFEGAEAALLFPTGYAANVGAISALARPEDVIFCDRLNHASLVDGCRLAQARLQVYRHTDLGGLERSLERANSYSRRWIVTDSIFSMDGDAAPLARLAELAASHDALLIVDEAHATGVYGSGGRGQLEAQGVPRDRVVSIGTLSKAIGAQGGFVAGSQTLIDWLWNKARTQVYSTALSPACCAAALAAIDLIDAGFESRQRLLEMVGGVVKSLREQGWEIPPGVAGPIIPVIIGDPQLTMELSRRLAEAGCLVGAIRPPTVPRGTSRLRLSLSLAHGATGVDHLLDVMEKLSKEFLPIASPTARTGGEDVENRRED